MKTEAEIFVFRTGSLGDAVAGLPAIKNIHINFSKKLHLITNKQHQGISVWEVYKHTGYFKDYFSFESNLKSLSELRKYIKNSGKERIMFYLVDISSVKRNLRNYILFKTLGFNKIFGVKECTGNYIKRNSNGKLIEVESEYERLEKIVCKSLNTNCLPVNYDFIKFDTSTIERMTKKFDFLQKQYIALGIGGKLNLQKWNIGNYICVINSIKKNLTVVILGGKADSKDAEFIKANTKKHVINLCGETTILESAYILHRAVIYFGNDTGTMHLASIVGTRCLVIESARNNPGRWNPYGKGHTIIRKHVNCEGCHLFTPNCPYDKLCLKSITCEEVLKHLERMLNNEKV